MLANNKHAHSTPVSHHYTSITRNSSFNQSINQAINPVINQSINQSINDSLLTPTLSPYAQPPSSPFFAASLFPPLNSPFLSPLTSFHPSHNQSVNQFQLTPLIESSGDPFSLSNNQAFNQPFAFNALPVVPALSLNGHAMPVNQSITQSMNQSINSSAHDFLSRSYTPSPSRLNSPLLSSLAASTSSGSDEEDDISISMKPLRFLSEQSYTHDDQAIDQSINQAINHSMNHLVDQSNEQHEDKPKSRLKRKNRSFSREKMKQKKRKSKSRETASHSLDHSTSPPNSPNGSVSDSECCDRDDGDLDCSPDCSVTPAPTTNIKLGVGSSCHQCKTRKLLPELFVCGNFDKKKVKVMKKKLCRKKYCARCLIKFYSQQPPETPVGATGCTSLGQDCPSCLGLCVCAACRKRYARDCTGNNGDSGKEEDEQSVTHHSINHSSGESDDEQRIAHTLKQQHQQQTILSLTAALSLPGTEISPLVDLIHMA